MLATYVLNILAFVLVILLSVVEIVETLLNEVPAIKVIILAFMAVKLTQWQWTVYKAAFVDATSSFQFATTTLKQTAATAPTAVLGNRMDRSRQTSPVVLPTITTHWLSKSTMAKDTKGAVAAWAAVGKAKERKNDVVCLKPKRGPSCCACCCCFLRSRPKRS